MGWTSDPLAPTSVPLNGRRVIYFDGTADFYVSTLAAADWPLHKAAGFTFSLIYNQSSTANDVNIFSTGANNTVRGTRLLSWGSAGKITWEVTNASGTELILIDTGLASHPRDNNYVVSGSWSESAGGRLLVNSSIYTAPTVGAASNDVAWSALNIGRRAAGNHYGGLIGDVYIRVGWVPDDALLKTHNYMRRRYAI
jgi:hypothetical protein